MTIAAVSLQAVTKTFQQKAFFSRKLKDETHALKGVSFEVHAGEVLGLLGPNGSGKSTTLKLVSTVLLSDSGRVQVGGFDAKSHGQQVRERVGFALASERSFFPRLTGRENLEFFAALEDVPRRECRARAESALTRAGLLDAADKQATKLSSGMYQRLAIARALLKRPAVLLLDEPSRSLDVAATAHLWGLIRGLSSAGMTILLATHNFAEAAEVCDRVAVLQNGSLADTFSTLTLSDRQLQRAYLELTDTKRRWSEEVPA